MIVQSKPWAELIAPIVARCELSAKLNMNAVFNPDGAKALGELLKRMAATLDDEVERR